jgi:hypothetical protein
VERRVAVRTENARYRVLEEDLAQEDGEDGEDGEDEDGDEEDVFDDDVVIAIDEDEDEDEDEDRNRMDKEEEMGAFLADSMDKEADRGED